MEDDFVGDSKGYLEGFLSPLRTRKVLGLRVLLGFKITDPRCLFIGLYL